jgi:quercetin dioxygenase-like cupin family protein
MHHVRVEDLPLRGSSRNFVGADQGGVAMSAFLFNGQVGSGPGLHRHPYDEIQFIQQGRGLWNVNGQEFEAGAGDVLVIKAGEVHGFKCTEAPLIQVDVHLSARFIQENL